MVSNPPDPPDHLDSVGHGLFAGMILVTIPWSFLLEYARWDWSAWFTLPILLGAMLGGFFGHKVYQKNRADWENRYEIRRREEESA